MSISCTSLVPMMMRLVEGIQLTRPIVASSSVFVRSVEMVELSSFSFSLAAMRRRPLRTAQWLLLALGSIVSTGQASSLPPLMLLGSKGDPHACVGVLITYQHAVVQSDCVAENEPITSASVLALNEDHGTENDQTPAVVAQITPVPAGNGTTHSTQVHLVTLQAPLTSGSVVSPATLPIRTPYPTHLQIDHEASLFVINLDTLQVSAIQGVTFVNGSLCNQPVCALPTEIEAREDHQESNQWSFLVKRATTGGGMWLLGFGGNPVTNRDGIWGFSWLPKLPSAATFPSLGVKTITTVQKEMALPRTDSIYREFLVGIRTSKDGESFCTGSLISSRYVLTAAHCKNNGTIKFVAFPDVTPDRKDGEVIAVRRLATHPNYRVKPSNGPSEKRTHYFDLLMLELERPSTRVPIQMVDQVYVYGRPNATFFAFEKRKEAKYGVREHVYFAVLPVINSINLCSQYLHTTTLQPQEFMVCAGGDRTKKPCLNETSAGPLVFSPDSVNQRLYAVSSTGVACGWLHAMYTRLTKAIPIIKEQLEKVTKAKRVRARSRRLVTLRSRGFADLRPFQRVRNDQAEA